MFLFFPNQLQLFFSNTNRTIIFACFVNLDKSCLILAHKNDWQAAFDLVITKSGKQTDKQRRSANADIQKWQTDIFNKCIGELSNKWVLRASLPLRMMDERGWRERLNWQLPSSDSFNYSCKHGKLNSAKNVSAI